MTDMIATAIGIVLVFLAVSLIVTATQELVAGFFGLRASQLEKGINNILADPTLAKSFYAHPLIATLASNLTADRPTSRRRTSQRRSCPSSGQLRRRPHSALMT